MDVIGKIHTPAAFTPGKKSIFLWMGGWLGWRDGLDSVNKTKSLSPPGKLLSNCPSSSLITTVYAGLILSKNRECIHGLHTDLTPQQLCFRILDGSCNGDNVHLVGDKNRLFSGYSLDGLHFQKFYEKVVFI